MKRELENLIKKEENRRNNLEFKINNYQLEEHKFIKRRNNSCSNTESHTTTRSYPSIHANSSIKVTPFKEI